MQNKPLKVDDDSTEWLGLPVMSCDEAWEIELECRKTMDDGPQLAHVNTGSLDTTKNKPLKVDESSVFLGYPVMNCEEAWGIELSCRKMMDDGPKLAHVDTGSMHTPKCVPSSSLLGVKRNTSKDLPPSPLNIQHQQQPSQYIQDQHQSPKNVGLQGQQAIQQPPQQRVFQAQKFSEQVQISMHPPELDLMNPLWCELCEVVCSSPDNLKQHQQGKKHTIKQSPSVPTRPSFVQQCVPSSSLLGVKRNTSEDLPPSLLKIQHRQQPPQYIQDLKLPVQQIWGQQSPQHVRLQVQQPIQQPPQQSVFPAQKFSEQVQISMHPPASDPMTLLWCELCEVVCSSPDNLKQHQQGKKHKMKVSECFTGERSNISIHRGMIWCPECHMPCMNEFALAQHRSGKKHLLRMLELNGCKDESQDHSGGEISNRK